MSLKVRSGFSNSFVRPLSVLAAIAFMTSPLSTNKLAHAEEKAVTKTLSVGDALLKGSSNIPTTCSVRLTGLKYAIKTFALPVVAGITSKGVTITLTVTESYKQPQSETVTVPYGKTIKTDVNCITLYTNSATSFSDSATYTFVEPNADGLKRGVVSYIVPNK